MTMETSIIRSNRRTISIEVTPDCEVIVRAPRRASYKDIERILKEKESWINKTVEKLKKRQEEYDALLIEPLTEEELKRLAKRALEVIPKRVEYYAEIIGVTYGRITIRSQKSRWGSCSSKGNLNFNCLLMLTPDEVIDYVVVHELCHRKQMNHSKAFWLEVSKVLPDYKKSVRYLKDEGGNIMRRRNY